MPLAPPAPERAGSAAVFGLSAVDCHGRINDRSILRSLGWVGGLRLAIQERAGLIVVVAEPGGVFCVSRQGYLQLPAVVRGWCGLAAGDRVFLAVDAGRSRMVVHPPAAIEAMVVAVHAAVWGGDQP